MSELPWSEKINLFQIHPDAAKRGDVARLATELFEARAASRELVEALKTIASWGTDGEVQDFARAAIAKATT